MTEYWKSNAKKFCDPCKCWFTDNKASVEFHERGLRHKANVEKKLNDVSARINLGKSLQSHILLRKKGYVKDKEQKQYNDEIMKIEAAALGSFQKDISANPKLASQLGTSRSMIDDLPIINETSASTSCTGRFGDQFGGDGESQVLVRGREKAFETIAKKLEKKSKWLEAKTSEGTVYYWNRTTYETVWDKPKSGFLSADDQKTMNITGPAPAAAPIDGVTFKHDPYGKWHQVNDKLYEDDMPDLQLPENGSAGFVEVEPVVVMDEKEKKPQLEFKEKTVEIFGKASFSKGDTMFKKRKATTTGQRNVRSRKELDE